MTRKLTRLEADALYAPRAQPMGWTGARNEHAVAPRSAERFDLTEQIILRRLAKKESGRVIAKGIGMSASVVNSIIKTMMERRGVETRAELLDLAVVKELLAEE